MAPTFCRRTRSQPCRPQVYRAYARCRPLALLLAYISSSPWFHVDSVKSLEHAGKSACVAVHIAASSAGPSADACGAYLSKAKVDKHTALRLIVVQEVGRFDISVNDTSSVNICETAEQAQHVRSDVLCIHVTIEMLRVSRVETKTYSKVIIAMIWHCDNDLIIVAEGSDELRDVATSPKTLKDLNLVFDALRTAGIIDSLEGDINIGHGIPLQRMLGGG
jgi:hypothetical protein